MSGTVNIARDLFDHGMFKPEVFTEREAWIWLIMQARWKSGAYRAGDFVVNLDRGQLAASVRFMAQAWGWTPAKVQRYQKRLINLEMISSKTDTGVTVTTICNYDKFQTLQQTPDTGPIQDRYRTDTEKKTDVIREEGKEREAKASQCLADQEECLQHFNMVAAQVGWSRVQSFTKERRAALSQRIKSVGGADQWREAINRAAMSPLLTGQAGSGWRADFDWLSKPANFTKLMEGNYDDRQPTSANHGARHGPHNALMAGFAIAADRLGRT